MPVILPSENEALPEDRTIIGERPEPAGASGLQWSDQEKEILRGVAQQCQQAGITSMDTIYQRYLGRCKNEKSGKRSKWAVYMMAHSMGLVTKNWSAEEIALAKEIRKQATEKLSSCRLVTW